MTAPARYLRQGAISETSVLTSIYNAVKLAVVRTDVTARLAVDFA